MRLIGKTTITTIEEPDHLQFVVTRENGWIDLCAPPAIVAVFAVGAWLSSHYVFALLGVLAYIVYLAKSLSNPTARLFVSQNELVARGNVEPLLRDKVSVKTSEIKSIAYHSGGENSPSGLYVNRGFLKQTCLLSGISKKQTDAIVDAIYKKFPNISA